MKQKHGREKKKSKSSFVCKHLIKYNVLMSILVRFIKIVFFLLLLAGSSSVYAACIVDGTSYNVGGTGLTSSSGAGGAITLAIIKDDWDTSGDDVSTCDVSTITSMYQIFRNEASFNQDIGTWDVSNVTTMSEMFYSADAFNQDISTWDVSNVTTMSLMLWGPTLSTANYDALLIAWDALELQDNVFFDAPSSEYTASSVASTARASIISTDNWAINDGGTVTDSSAPTLSSSSPADGATSVAVDANIVLTFSEKIYVKTGNITLKKSSDDSTVETIAVTDSKITGTGTTTITIDPSTTLDQETGYYLNIAATAFDDTASNSYAGISSTTALSFTTATAPTLSSSTPADNATAVAISSNIVLNFSEAVDVESGNITIYKTSDGSTVETIDVTSGLVTGIEKRLNI